MASRIDFIQKINRFQGNYFSRHHAFCQSSHKERIVAKMMRIRAKCFGNQVNTARAKSARLRCTQVIEEWTEGMLSPNNFMSAVKIVCVCVYSCECLKLYVSVIYISTYVSIYTMYLWQFILVNSTALPFLFVLWENKQPNQEVGQRTTQTLLQRRHADG